MTLSTYLVTAKLRYFYNLKTHTHRQTTLAINLLRLLLKYNGSGTESADETEDQCSGDHRDQTTHGE